MKPKTIKEEIDLIKVDISNFKNNNYEENILNKYNTNKRIKKTLSKLSLDDKIIFLNNLEREKLKKNYLEKRLYKYKTGLKNETL
jgi:NCAIR mutase (PurE)-related protein